MHITRKEIKTEIHAEISKNEYCIFYYEMMLELHRKNLLEPRIHKDEILEYINASDEEKTNIAEKSFIRMLDDSHDACIRFIAKRYGYNVSNYGYTNIFLEVLKVVFVQEGAHIE